VLDGCWTGAGRVLEGCWKGAGRVLEGCWKGAEWKGSAPHLMMKAVSTIQPSMKRMKNRAGTCRGRSE
jgi:hypothetical protein